MKNNDLQNRIGCWPGGVWKLCAAILVAGAFALAPLSALAQKAFPSPGEAAEAFVDAVARDDGAALRTILGEDWKKFIPVDVDREDTEKFLEAWKRSHRVVPEGDARAMVEVGTQGWTLPIPIVKVKTGWQFDTRAAAEELRTRRIGRNELSAMQTVLAYYDAQKDYAEKDRNGDGVLEYAQKLISTPGKKDGLYWPTAEGEEESPAGPAYAEAKAGSAYHGYFFHILKAQGKDAKGGAFDYVVKGRMIGGFALVAWPAKYGDTGVMTFIINHDGVIFEKDLGPSTDSVARAMTRFNPDASWKVVDPDK